jgi:predicted TIM-barrel fold metal-dependent hydrolase
MILVSVDDHVIEPGDAFVKHMSPKFKSRAPVVESHNGKDYWKVDGKLQLLGGLNAVVGRPKDEYGIEPNSYAEIRKGCYDVKARVEDMNVNGVLASVCFPNLIGFGGGLALTSHDREYGKALVQAYNDWHVADWAGAAPGRLIPLAALPLWDIEATVQEVKRLAAMGVHAVVFPENPGYGGQLPSIHSDFWDPLWRVCSDNAVIVCTHIGTAGPPPVTNPDQPVCAWAAALPLATSFSLADWLFSPMWKKFPKLRTALAEAGAGWVPFLLERTDYAYRQHREWTRMDLGKDLPSEIFRRHFLTCFLSDRFGVMNHEWIGIDNISWECDFPHSDCTWPHSPEVAWESVKGLSDEYINKVTHGNALRDFSFDPFKFVPREEATVGALRYASRHIDTSPIYGLGGVKPGNGGAVNMGHMMAMLASSHPNPQ